MTTANSPASKEVVTAALLVIGGKILSGRTKDQNIGYIAENLTAVGIDLKEVRVVGDEERAIVTMAPLNQCNELALGIGVAVDVPLRGLDRPVACQQLHVPQRAACLMNNASGAGDERAAA